MVLGAETAHVGSGLMGRIIQLRRILAQSKFGSGEGRLIFKIEDKLNPSNTEPLAVQFENGKVDFVKQNGSEIKVRTDIATLSSIFWGKLNVREAVYFGLVEIEGKGDTGFIDRVFSFPKSICLDHF